MKVFLAWSGDESKAVAKGLRDWLPCVLRSCEPWMSEGIGKGKRWNDEISKQLALTKFGIICLTPEAAESPWVMFEAGAIAKSVGDDADVMVTPLKLGVENSGIPSPLASFQTTDPHKEDIRRLVVDLNKASESKQDGAMLDRQFEKWWPDIQEVLDLCVDRVGSASPQQAEAGSEGEPSVAPKVLEEILGLARATEREVSRLGVHTQGIGQHLALSARGEPSPLSPLGYDLGADEIWKVQDHIVSGLGVSRSDIEFGADGVFRVRLPNEDTVAFHDVADVVPYGYRIVGVLPDESTIERRY